MRVGLIDGRYVINPTYDEVRESRLNLIVAGTEEAIVMVEAGAQEVSEEIMVEALMLAHKEINRLCRWQKELYKALEIEKRPFESPKLNEEMVGEVERNYTDRLRAALDTATHGKIASYAAVDALKKEVVESPTPKISPNSGRWRRRFSTTSRRRFSARTYSTTAAVRITAASQRFDP